MWPLFSESDIGIISHTKNNDNFYEIKSWGDYPLNCSRAMCIRVQEDLNKNSIGNN